MATMGVEFRDGRSQAALRCLKGARTCNTGGAGTFEETKGLDGRAMSLLWTVLFWTGTDLYLCVVSMTLRAPAKSKLDQNWTAHAQIGPPVVIIIIIIIIIVLMIMVIIVIIIVMIP